MTLVNVGEFESHAVVAPDFPRDLALGQHTKSLARTVYIDREDFHEIDDAAYFGLALNKVAGLRYAGYVRVTGIERDAAGAIVGLTAEYDHTRSAAFAGAGVKVKGNLHWVSEGAAPCDLRLFSHLFLDNLDGDLGELNPASETVIQGALADACLAGAKPLEHFQFERVGFFTADADCVGGRLVFNLTVGLKEGAEAKKVRG